MRSFAPLLLSALLAACGTRADKPVATVDAPPPSLGPDLPFAAPRPLDAPADPAVASADGRTSVEIGVLEPSDDTQRLPADPAALRAEVERNAGLLQRCWESRVDALPVREGVVEIHAHIGPDGLVDGQCIGEDSVGDEAVRRCANDLLAMGRYPASDRTVDVTFQLRLMSPRL